jgi:RHS repeat-associated protein
MNNTSNPYSGATAVRGGQSGSVSKNNVLNSVNMYRGNLGFAFTVAYLDGRDGLGASVQINYAPSHEEMFSRKNIECTSSVVGCNWALPLMSIAVLSRTQRQTYNVDYYMISEGGEYPLYQTGKVDDDVIFYSVEHPLWKIKLVNAAMSYWEIVRENGQVYTYGGTDDSLEVNVAWDNFTGASDSVGGKPFPVGWYASKIEAPAGGILTFTYDNVKTPLGGSAFTSEIHLKSVISAYKQTINLHYLPKETDEYTLPNAPQNGKLYYQSLNECHYLDYAEIKNENNTPLYRQQFEYKLVPSATGERKRLLVSVTQILPSGEAMPAYTFEYDLQTGWLTKQTMPQSGSVTYGYEPQTLAEYDPFVAVNVQQGAVLITAAGADFVATASMYGGRLSFSIHSSDVKWKVFADDYFHDVPANKPKIYIGDGLVALLYFKLNRNYYTLRLYKRNPVRQFDWDIAEYDLDETDLPTVACGDSFVAVQYTSKRELCVWQYNYTTHSWDTNSLSVDPQKFNSLCAGKNCVFGAYSQGGNSVRLISFYADESHTWQRGNYLDVPAKVNWQYADTLPQLSLNASIGSAAFFDYDKGTNTTTATLIAFNWDIKYALTDYCIFEVSESRYIQNPIEYTVASDTMVGFANTAFRYTPGGWVKCALLTPLQNCEYVYGYGSDLFLGAEYDGRNVKYYAARFDPYTNEWTNRNVPVCKSLRADKITPPMVSGSYSLIGNAVFLRDSGGSWNLLNSLSNDAELSSAKLNSIGGAYIIHNISNKRIVRLTPLYESGFADSVDFEGEALDPSISYGAFVAYFISSGVDGTVRFRKLSGNRYTNQYTQSAVTSVCYDAGLSQQNFHIQYDNASARIDGSAIAMPYVMLIPKDLSAPLGKTIYSYFSGAAPDDFKYPDDPTTNVKNFYSRFSGRLSSVSVYNADGSQVSEDITYSSALDAAGINIVQSRNVKREFVHSFDWTSQSSSSNLVTLETVIDNEYDTTYFTLKKSTKTAYDKAGSKIVTSRTFRRACDDYPELLQLNILTKNSGSVSKDENSGVTFEAERFIWSKNAVGRWYQSATQMWNGTDEPDYEQGANWIQQSTVVQVDDYCNVLCSNDRSGIFTVTIYDKAKNIIIAEIDDCKPNEVLYCGFESYEDISRLTLNGADVSSEITSAECYSGMQSLRVLGGAVFKAAIGSVRNGGLLAHFAVKAAAELTLQCGGITKTISEDIITFGEWCEVSLNLSDKALTNTITLASSADFYIDTIFVTPLTAKGSASVFSGDFLNLTAKHNNTGGGERVFGDRTQKTVAKADCYGNFTEYTDTFFDTTPRMSEILAVSATSSGALYSAAQGYTANPLIARIGNTFKCTAAERFAAFVSGNETIALAFGATVIAVHGGKWVWTENGTVKATADVPPGKNCLLIKYGGKLRFSGEGSLLFAGTMSERGNVILTVSGETDVLGYIPDPVVAIKYSDLAGLVVQTHNLSPIGLLVKQNFYDAAGMLEAETATGLISDWDFGYRDKFTDGYSGISSPVGGEISALIPEANGYPYTAVRRSRNQLGTPLESGGLGAELRIGGGHTAIAETVAAVHFPFVTADNVCKATTLVGMDNIRTTRVSDGTGEIMTICGSGDSAAITAYEYNAKGLATKVYYPNYFGGDTNAVGALTYDALGHISSRKDPDGAFVNTIYDTDGKLRFIQSDSSIDSYVYHIYDSVGRETEVGSVNDKWDGDELRKLADTVGISPDGAVWAKRICYYDGTDTSKCFENSRISKVTTASGTDTVTELYGYDKFGNVTDYTVTVNGHAETVKSNYDLSGRLTSRRTGVEADGELTYEYDIGGRIKGINYNGVRIYECDFDANGRLTAETLGGLARSYEYNTAQALANISDKFFTQSLSYNNGRISSIATTINGADSDFAQTHVRTAEYDTSGRMTNVDDGSGALALRYDRSSNLMRGFDGSERTYQQGTNRLLSEGDKSFAYNGVGGTTSASDYEISYDTVFENVSVVRSKVEETRYVYGADGICAVAENGGMDYMVTIGGKTFCTRRSDGTFVLFVRSVNGVIAQIVNGKRYHLLKDYQGSVCAVYDGSGVCEAYRYSVSGAVARSWTVGGDLGLVPIRFAGACYVAAAGLYQFESRLYDPQTGRFLSFDPKVQFPNPYIYGGADWINYFDPDGAWSWACFGAILGGIVVAVAGIALTIASAGIAAPALALCAGVFAAGIAGAGMASAVYGVSAAISGDFNVKDWGISVGAGFIFGMITAGAGAAVPSGLFTGLGVSSAVSTFLVDTGVGIVIGATDGYVTNGVINVAHSRDFNDGGWQSALIGGAVGGFFGAVGGLSSGYRTNVARNLGRQAIANDRIGIATEIHSAKFDFDNYDHSVLREYRGGGTRGRDIWPIRTNDGTRICSVRDRSAALDAGAESEFRISPRTSDKMAGVLDRMTPGKELGDFSVYTNSCTGNVVNWIAAADICPPVWVRWPNALRFWAWLGQSS